MNRTVSYETEPENVAIAETAIAEWKRFKGERSEGEAMTELIALHLLHIRTVQAKHFIPLAMGSMFVTDVEGFDLALVDANFPHLRQRHVSLFTRKGVGVIIELLQAGSGQKVQ